MSKYKRDEPQSLPKHRHCSTCGTPIDMSRDYCSEKCGVERKRVSRARNRNFILIMGAVMIFYLFILFAKF